jgi:class 3 adenylate cyclase/tetratricopeptide (TPR) repeat protein
VARRGTTCARCGRGNRSGARFCDQCGAPLEHGQARAPEAERTLDAERKHVTVLFADLRASLEMLADVDAEETQRLLDPILTLMIDAVHEHEGIVNQVLGDGIMALFGAPAAYEDHAVRACHAALAIQAAMARHAATGVRGSGPELKVRVGINSGEVVLRVIGSDFDVDYSAVGRTTHIASRLEQLAAPDTVLIGPTTRRLAGRYVTAQSLGLRPIKGLQEPMEVFQLVAVGPARAPWEATRERWRTAFVGREPELAELRAAAVDALAGRAQVVAVAGEPGVGKSRLAGEFSRTELADGWTVLESGTVSYGRSRAYAPIVELLRTLFDLGDTLDPGAVRTTIARVLRSLDCPPADAAALLAFLSVPGAEAGWDDLDPIQRRDRTFQAIARVVRARARARPLCLVLEDLHWIDAESEALLDHLLSSLADSRVLMITTYRPEYEDPWRGRPFHRLLPIKAMSGEMAARLLTALLGADARLDDVKTLLIERTGGNPFFVEESVWNLVEARALVGHRGSYHLAKPVALDEVPDRVEAVVSARIDRLRPQEKALLQCAAMIGVSFAVALVEALTGLRPDVVIKVLRDLESLDLVLHDPAASDLRYRFTHSLTVDVIRGAILSDRRRAFDARIVEASERLGLNRSVEQIEALAQYAQRGEVWDKAVTYCRAAGERAFARSAHRSAVEYFERALDALAHLPESDGLVGQAIDVRLDLRSALIPLGDLPRIVQTLREAETLAERAHDRRRLGLVSSFLTVLFHLTGNLGRAIERGERALAIARELDDRTIRVVANAYLGLTCHTAGDYARALVIARENIRLLAGDARHERFGMTVLPAVYSRTCLIWCLAERGEFEEAARVVDEALAIAEAAGHPYSRIYAHLGAGVLHARRADVEAAIATLETALTLCRDAEIDALFATLAVLLVPAYAKAGRPAAALELLDRATAVAEAISDPVVHWLRTGSRAEALLAAGRAPEALPLAVAYRDQRRKLGAKGYEAWAALLVGQVQAGVDGTAAEAAYGEALALATRLDMAPLRAHCHLDLGRLLLAAGRRDEARAALSTARTLFDGLGMLTPVAECARALAATSFQRSVS